MEKGLLTQAISFDMLNIAMVLGDADAIEMPVDEGIGVAFISRLAAARGLEFGRVVEVGVEGMRLYRKIYLACNQRFPYTRPQNEFWEFVHQADFDMVSQINNKVSSH